MAEDDTTRDEAGSSAERSTPRPSRSPQNNAGGAAEESDDDDEAFNPDDFGEPAPYEAPEPARTTVPGAEAHATTLGKRLFG